MKKFPVSRGFVSSRLVWSPEETDLDPVALRLPARLRSRLARVCRFLAVAKHAPSQRGEKPPVQILLQRMTQDSRARTLISWVKILEKAVDGQATAKTQQSGRVANS